MAITTLRPLRPRRAILLRKDAQLGLFGGETEVKPTAAAKRRERMLQPKAPPKPPKPSTRTTAPKEGDTRINRAGNEEVLRAGRWRLASNPKVVAKDKGSAAIVPVVEAEKPMPEVDEDAIGPVVEEPMVEAKQNVSAEEAEMQRYAAPDVTYTSDGPTQGFPGGYDESFARRAILSIKTRLNLLRSSEAIARRNAKYSPEAYAESYEKHQRTKQAFLSSLTPLDDRLIDLLPPENTKRQVEIDKKIVEEWMDLNPVRVSADYVRVLAAMTPEEVIRRNMRSVPNQTLSDEFAKYAVRSGLYWTDSRTGGSFQLGPDLTRELKLADRARRIFGISVAETPDDRGQISKPAAKPKSRRKPIESEPTAVPAEVVDDEPKPTKLGDRIRAIANDLRDENDEQKKIAARILGAAAQMAQNYDNLVGEVVDMVGEDLGEDIRSLNPDATQADVEMAARDGGSEPSPTRLADKMKAIANDLRNETNEQVKATARILDAAAQIAQNYDNLVDEVAEMVGEDLEAGGGAIGPAVEETLPKVERHPDKTPWLYTAVEYQYAKNVPLPMLGEISPLQLGRMSKRQREQYLKENAKKWEASARIKQEWRDKVWQAYQNGEFRLEDVPKSSSKGLFDVNAKELISIREVAQKKADEERLINEAREENQIKDVSQIEIGDRIYHPIFKRYGIVEKKFKNSIRVLDENGDIYKVDARVAQWRSYDDMKEAALNGEAMRPPTPVLPEEEVKPKTKAKAKPKITNVTNSEFWGDSLSSKTDLMIGARRAAEKLGQRSPTVDRLYVLEEKINQQPDPENYRIIRIKGRETSYAAIYEPLLTKSLPPGPVFTLMGVPYIFDPNRAVLRKAGTSWEQFVADLSKEADDDPCWEGYEAVGMKKKRGKMVPNCVPTN
jgi:hypothetical protein